MRKTALILAVVMLLSVFAMPIHAAEPRMTTIIPDLSFSGTTATCTVRITGNSLDEEMVATIKLFRGSTLIATWTAEGNGYIFFEKTRTVIKGYTYKLVVELTVDGEAFTPVYVSGNC